MNSFFFFLRADRRLSRLYWTLPSHHPFPDYVINLKYLHCYFFFKSTLVFISCHTEPLLEIYFAGTDSKWDNIDINRIWGQYELLRYGL